MADRIQFRRDTSARWKEVNPILAEGEIGYETDTKLRKLGDGVNSWNALDYDNVENLTDELGDSSNLAMSQKGVRDEIDKIYGNVFRYRGGVNYNTGNAADLESGYYYYTDYIPISKNSIIHINAVNTENLTPCAFYDKDFVFISSIHDDVSNGMVDLLINSSNIPDNAKYIRSTGSSIIHSSISICTSDLVYNLLYEKQVLENKLSLTNNVYILNSNPNLCIEIDTSNSTITIPSSLVVLTCNTKFNNTVEQTINYDTSRSNILVYNFNENSFKAILYSDTIPDNYYIVGTIRSRELHANTNFYKVNGKLYTIQARTLDENDLYNNTSEALVSVKYLNKLLDNKSKLICFEWNNDLHANFNENLKAIKFLRIYTSNINSSTYYSLQRLYKEDSLPIKFYIRSIEDDSKVGEFSIEESDKINITDNIWYAKKQTSDRNEIEIIVDDSLIVSNFGSSSEGFIVLKNCYYYNNNYENNKYLNKQYCNLGASSSLYPWHKEAVSRLGAIFKSYAVGGSAWRAYAGAELDYSDAPVAKNRVMMNQVARLFKDNTETGYTPDSITLMCGLGDTNASYAGSGTNGSFEDAMSVELGDITPETWFNLNDNDKRNTAKSISYIIQMLTNRFPHTQLILICNYSVTNPTYPTEELIKVNSLIREIANRFSIPIIDFEKECGINDLLGNANLYLKDDQLHPNDEGNKLLANFGELKLRQVISYRK